MNEIITNLTRKERRILELIASGVESKELPGELNITKKTLKVHRSHIINKLGASNMAHAVAMLYEYKIKQMKGAK